MQFYRIDGGVFSPLRVREIALHMVVKTVKNSVQPVKADTPKGINLLNSDKCSRYRKFWQATGLIFPIEEASEVTEQVAK